MALKMKKKFLADKINSLVSAAPTNFDSDDDADDTRAKVVDHDDESDDSANHFQVSSIRRRNINLLDQLDERYKGKKVSRKDAYSDDDDSINTTENDVEEEEEDGNEISSLEDDEEESSDNENSIDENVDDEDNVFGENDDSCSEDEIDDNESVISSVGEESDDNVNENRTKEKTNFKTISRTNLRADIEKGNCVRNQLKLWESLLEVRIKLQKCLVTSNQMPRHDVYKAMKENVEYTKRNNESRDKLRMLLNNMLRLQNILLKQYPETTNLSSRNRKRKAEDNVDSEIMYSGDAMDEEIPSDAEDENDMDDELISDEDRAHDTRNIFGMKLRLNDYEKMLNESHESYTGYRDSVIQKWNEKTKLVSGKLNKDTNQTTLKQIEFTLSDKAKLRRRTQLRRSEYKIVGKTDSAEDDDDEGGRRTQEYDTEIYDDDDFYHQLLRDLIERKSADVTDPIQLSKQWIQLQNMRSKMKRKIDTRATKGRRIRYNVHNKLVNFMAPITVNDTWSDQAKDELYNSLFGKIKSTN